MEHLTNFPLLSTATADNNQLILTAQDLVIGYNSTPIVKDIHLHLSCGQTIALVGMNGSGKSTLLKTIAGLISPLGGTIEVFHAAPGKLPHRIGYLNQFHTANSILPLQVIDIVSMGRYPWRGLLGKFTSEDQDIIHAALEMMEMSEFAHQPLHTLSGGQQQRVFIAQVLAQQADLYLLDEPTANLDLAGKELFRQALENEKKRGAATVVATHDIREAAECDLVMLLAQQVIAFGPPQQT
jgi:ABC-type Mn2+/Zn2+ transport system ATPase subunit